MKNIILSQTHKAILTKHAKGEEPNESCALLFGRENKVLEIFLTRNTKESPVNFAISNEQLLDAYKQASMLRMEVIGIFHSHPTTEAYPSNTDKKFMQSNPVVWIIYSGNDEDFKAYQMDSELVKVSIVDE